MSAKPYNTLEAAAAGVARACVDGAVSACVVITSTGLAAELVAKYRPPVPILVGTEPGKYMFRHVLQYGMYPKPVGGGRSFKELDNGVELVECMVAWGKKKGYVPG